MSSSFNKNQPPAGIAGSLLNFTRLACALVLAGTSLTGCGGGSSPDAAAFDSAAPEIKAQWTTAVAADKANDYFTAATAYSSVVQQQSKLTPKQFDTAETASRTLMQRTMDAAKNGDAKAKEALARLMSTQVGK